MTRAGADVLRWWQQTRMLFRQRQSAEDDVRWLQLLKDAAWCWSWTSDTQWQCLIQRRRVHTRRRTCWPESDATPSVTTPLSASAVVMIIINSMLRKVNFYRHLFYHCDAFLCNVFLMFSYITSIGILLSNQSFSLDMMQSMMYGCPLNIMLICSLWYCLLCRVF